MKLLYLALAAGAAAKYRKNDQCGDGQFCNVEKECEACYYGRHRHAEPRVPALVGACGYACDGSDYAAATRRAATPGTAPTASSTTTRSAGVLLPGDLTLGTGRATATRTRHAACDGGADTHSHGRARRG